MERGINFAPEEYFHIYNRGTDKRVIFNNAGDYQRFLESLYLFNSTERIVFRLIPKKERLLMIEMRQLWILAHTV